MSESDKPDQEKEPTPEELDAYFGEVPRDGADELAWLTARLEEYEIGKKELARARDLAFHSRDVQLSENVKKGQRANYLGMKWLRKRLSVVKEAISGQPGGDGK